MSMIAVFKTRSIRMKKLGFEVKLSTRMEVYFDKDGTFLGQKFDD